MTLTTGGGGSIAGDWADPEFLQNLRDQGTRVRVDQGGAAGLALTLKRR